MEIAPGVHRIKCLFDEDRMAFVHVLVGDEAIMLVDTCCSHNPQQEILPYMKSIGIQPTDLTYILVSHSDMDHQGGNQPMKDAAPQAILMCHNLDLPWIESTDALINGRYLQFVEDHGMGGMDESGIQGVHDATLSAPIDMTLEGGETFRLSADWYVEAIHTPGHTWGHLAIYDPRGKALIAGEAAIWHAILDINWNPVMPPTYCYVDTYLSTIDRLLSMDIEVYSGAHWQVQTGSQVAEFLEESRNYCLFVERKLLELSRERPFTLQDAADTLGAELGEWEQNNDMLMFPMTGNLTRLVQREQLTTSRNEAGHIVWQSVH